jgi:rod shape-determining protein MreC
VKYRAGSVLRLAVPFRALTQRFAFLFLILAAFGLMMIGKAETLLIERVRTGVIDVVAPIMDVLSRPAAKVTAFVDDMRHLTELRSENEQLREQNARLLQWQEAARKLSTENATLRELLNIVPDPRVQYASARVISDSIAVFARSVLINAGGRDGIAKGQAVMTGDGLAGRIISVGDGSARALLITDLNSRIPAVIEESRERAIVAGDNSSAPRLTFIGRDNRVELGNRVVTSGHGGAFPPGLPIGVVSEIESGVIRIQPFVRFDRLEFVRIADFSGVIAADETMADPDSGRP